MANSYELVLVSSGVDGVDEAEAAVGAIAKCCRERGAAVVSSHTLGAIEIVAGVAERKAPEQYLNICFDPSWDPRRCPEAISQYHIPSIEEIESRAGEISARVIPTAPGAYEQEEADYPARLHQALFDVTRTGSLVVVTPPAAIKTCFEIMGAEVKDDEIPVFSLWTIKHGNNQATNTYAMSDYEDLKTFVRSRDVPEPVPSLPPSAEVTYTSFQPGSILDNLEILNSQVLSDDASSGANAASYSGMLPSDESIALLTSQTDPQGAPLLAQGGENPPGGMPDPAQFPFRPSPMHFEPPQSHEPSQVPLEPPQQYEPTHAASDPPQAHFEPPQSYEPPQIPFKPPQPYGPTHAASDTPQVSFGPPQFHEPPQVPPKPRQLYEPTHASDPPQLLGDPAHMMYEPPHEPPAPMGFEPPKGDAAHSPPQFRPPPQSEPVYEESTTEKALESKQEESSAVSSQVVSPEILPILLPEEKKINADIILACDSMIGELSTLLNSKLYPGRRFNPLEQAVTIISKELREMEAQFARAMNDFREEVAATKELAPAPREEIEALLRELEEVAAVQQEVENTLAEVTERIVPSVTALKERVSAAMTQQEALKLRIRGAMQEKQDLAMPLQVVQVRKDEDGKYWARVKSRKMYQVWGFVAVHRNGEQIKRSNSTVVFDRVKEFDLSEIGFVPTGGPFEVVIKHYLDLTQISNSLRFE